MDNISNYKKCLESKVPVEPQELPDCANCYLSIGQCQMITSVIPCRCSYYSKYLKDWKERNNI